MEQNNQYKTEQERFWTSEFGDEYVDRNRDASLTGFNTALFTKVLSRTESVRSLIEFGANIGLNLIAIRNLLPEVELSAVEINQKAVEHLRRIEKITVYPMSILDFKPDTTRNFVLTKGVLIHINPEFLPKVYELLYRTSHRYICVIEYYNRTPVEVPYRGHEGVLFKRDFAGELLDRFQDLRLVDYGFVYHRDDAFPQDDITWFLLEKKWSKVST